MDLLGILQRPMEDQVSFIVTQTKFSSAPIPQTINNDRSLCKCKKVWNRVDPNEIKKGSQRGGERGKREKERKKKGERKDRQKSEKKREND